MATHDNTYSRLIAWLKVLLPVMALVLLSTMFLISRSIDQSGALTYANVDLEELAESQRITGPRFSGVTDDGAAVSFSAEIAQPDHDNPAIYTATGLQAQIATLDGGVIDINAGKAIIDGDANRLELRDGVTLQTSTNYEIHAEGLRTAMDITWMQSIGPVTASGPVGSVSAGQIGLIRQGDGPGTYLLVFKGGVKMVYLPQVDKDQ